MTPRHSRLHQPAVGLLPRHYLIGEGVSVPELLSAPLSSFGGQPATLMAAAPVRQRSGPGGQRAQLPPCYYEGYLEKRGPKEKVGSPGAHQLPYFGFGASCRCWKSVCVCICVYGPHTGWATIPRELSTSLLCENGWGETALLLLAGIYLIHTAVKHIGGKACNDVASNHSVWMTEITTAVEHYMLLPHEPNRTVFCW